MLAKYVPGGVWTPAARVVAARRAGITDAALVTASMLLEAGISAVAGVIVFVVSLALVDGVKAPLAPLIAFGVVVAVLVHPRVFRPLAARDPAPARLRPRAARAPRRDARAAAPLLLGDVDPRRAGAVAAAALGRGASRPRVDRLPRRSRCGRRDRRGALRVRPVGARAARGVDVRTDARGRERGAGARCDRAEPGGDHARRGAAAPRRRPPPAREWRGRGGGRARAPGRRGADDSRAGPARARRASRRRASPPRRRGAAARSGVALRRSRGRSASLQRPAATPARAAAPSAVVSRSAATSTGTRQMSARNWVRNPFSVAPPSTRSEGGRSGRASSTSRVWKAIDSSAARTRCSRRVPRVSPETSPRASGAQCGEPSPVSAGTKWTPSLEGTERGERLALADVAEQRRARRAAIAARRPRRRSSPRARSAPSAPAGSAAAVRTRPCGGVEQSPPLAVEHEGARAVGRLRLARARCSRGRRATPAGRRRARRPARGSRPSRPSPNDPGRAAHLGQQLAGHGEEVEQVVAPVERREVEQHRARRVRDVGRVHGAAGQPPEQPGVDGAEGERRPRRAAVLAEQPLELRRREVGVGHEPAAGLDLLRGQLAAAGRGAAILPDDRRRDRPARVSLPEQGRLALVRDPDRRRPRRPGCPAAASAAPAACPTLCQSASGSCSTQPGRGVETSTGTVARPTTSSSSPTTRQVVPVVPWSIARSMRPLSRVRGRRIGPLRTVRAWCA